MNTSSFQKAEQIPSQESNTGKKVALGLLLLMTFATGWTGGYYKGSTDTNRDSSQETSVKTIPSSSPVPVVTPVTEDETPEWKTHMISDAGLTFSAPADLDVTSEIQKNSETGVPSSLTLYIQKGTAGSDFYQLYGIYQWDVPYTSEVPQERKAELEPGTLKDITASGYPAIQGQIQGQRNRFVTYVLTDKGMFSLFTAEPTIENKQLSESIIETFKIE